jgi:signal-transduction protein with cAMP-binding, CBS, and nucleotidyltransferase domain
MNTHTPTSANLARSTVRDAMQLGLFECTPDAGIETLARTMAERSIHCVVVAGIDRRDARGEHLTWGIVSDLDLMRGLSPALEGTTAGELAATDIVVVEPTDTLEHAAQLMAEHDNAHLVVASPETGRPVGMLSTLDVARAIAAS